MVGGLGTDSLVKSKALADLTCPGHSLFLLSPREAIMPYFPIRLNLRIDVESGGFLSRDRPVSSCRLGRHPSPHDISSLPVCHPPATLESVQCTPRKWETDDLLAQSHGRRPASRSCSSREAFQIRLSYEHTRNSSIFSYENMVFSYKQSRGPATKMRAPTARSSYGTLRDAASLSCIRRCPVKGHMRSHVYTLGASC